MKNSLILGLGVAAALSLSSSAAAQCTGSGMTTTTFVGGNQQAGNMFDVIVGASDMTIDCIDINTTAAVSGYTWEVYYCTGTSVGNETNPAAWTLITTVSNVTGLGPGVATNLDLGGTSPTFLAGQTYGIYVQNPNYPTPGYMHYTNGGPTSYLGDDCDILTNCGTSVNFGGGFFYREFNGTLHTSAGPAGPALALSCGAGSATADITNCTPGGPIAVIYGPAGLYVHGGAQCNGIVMDLVPAAQPLILFGDATGAASITKSVGTGACGSGILVQAADVSTCTPTNAEAL